MASKHSNDGADLEDDPKYAEFLKMAREDEAQHKRPRTKRPSRTPAVTDEDRRRFREHVLEGANPFIHVVSLMSVVVEIACALYVLHALLSASKPPSL